MLWYSLRGILFVLTQDKDLRGGPHRGYAIGNAALPCPLVVLGERLQQQRTIGFYGVRDATSQVDLKHKDHPQME